MNKMIIGTICVLMLSLGCTTTDNTPYPLSMHAVIVGTGCNCDKQVLRKKGADLDVTTMTEIVNAAYGTSEFRKSAYRCTVLKDNMATTSNVKNAIKNALQYDLTVLYFSCLAGQIQTDDKSESDGKDEYLELYDGKLVDNEIWDLLQTAKGRVFIVFDTDYSQTMFRTSSTNANNIVMFDNVHTDSINMICWSACSDECVVDKRGVGSRLTNALYFKMTYSDTYDRAFSKILKSLDGKQDVKETKLGKDFGSLTFLR